MSSRRFAHDGAAHVRYDHYFGDLWWGPPCAFHPHAASSKQFFRCALDGLRTTVRLTSDTVTTSVTYGWDRSVHSMRTRPLRSDFSDVCSSCQLDGLRTTVRLTSDTDHYFGDLWLGPPCAFHPHAASSKQFFRCALDGLRTTVRSKLTVRRRPRSAAARPLAETWSVAHGQHSCRGPPEGGPHRSGLTPRGGFAQSGGPPGTGFSRQPDRPGP